MGYSYNISPFNRATEINRPGTGRCGHREKCPWLPDGGAGRPNGLTEGVWFVEWQPLKVTDDTPFAAVAARNRGMIATGNHYYLDSLRGAPPPKGAAGSRRISYMEKKTMIKTNRSGELEYLTAEHISAPHCFTTRLGGVSRGYLESLNIGTSRGDDPENVVENYRRLGAAVGFDVHDLVLSRQVHSDIVHTATARDRGAGLFAPHLEDCDALITRTPGLALVVFAADCTPILFWDSRTHAVGAAHAGWRGTVSAIGARVVEEMGRQFGSRPQDIRAAIGPNIGQCHFETNADVPQALRAAFGRESAQWIEPRGEKFHVDLKGINRWILNRAGVEQVEVSDACTVCSSSRFWSHRVTGGQRGSQGAIIVCQEDTI